MYEVEAGRNLKTKTNCYSFIKDFHFEDEKNLILVVDGKRYRYHHSAMAMGYISVKELYGKLLPYEGRFGKGWAVDRHSSKSNRYCDREYYIEIKEDESVA